jgi:hypothetical protein
MSDEKNLKKSLISAFEQLRTQYGIIAAMICDVAALRTVVLGDSPEMQTKYATLFAREIEEATPAIAAGTKLYDELILTLKAESRWLN